MYLKVTFLFLPQSDPQNVRLKAGNPVTCINEGLYETDRQLNCLKIINPNFITSLLYSLLS